MSLKLFAVLPYCLEWLKMGSNIIVSILILEICVSFLFCHFARGLSIYFFSKNWHFDLLIFLYYSSFLFKYFLLLTLLYLSLCLLWVYFALFLLFWDGTSYCLRPFSILIEEISAISFLLSNALAAPNMFSDFFFDQCTICKYVV